MSCHPLANFEIRRYYQNEPIFNRVYCRDNLAKEIKDGAYVVNLEECADIAANWIALYCKNREIIYFDSFGAEHIPKETEKPIEHKIIKTYLEFNQIIQ